MFNLGDPSFPMIAPLMLAESQDFLLMSMQGLTTEVEKLPLPCPILLKSYSISEKLSKIFPLEMPMA